MHAIICDVYILCNLYLTKFGCTYMEYMIILVHGPRGVTVYPSPRILHEWYHFVQGTPLINHQDVNAL